MSRSEPTAERVGPLWGRRIRRVSAGLLIFGVFFGPLAFGATEAWSLAVLQVGAAAAAGVWLIAGRMGLQTRPGRLWRAILRDLLWLPAAIAVLGLCQILPLPARVLSAISPLAGEAYGELQAEGIASSSACVSVSPGATLAAVRQMFLMALVAVVAADVARDGRVRRWLARGVAASGCLVLLLGFVSWVSSDNTFLGLHDMRGPVKGYKNPLLSPLHSAGFGYPERVRVGEVSYLVDEWNLGDVFGPYVVSNHFAGCMELTLPLAVALVLAGRGDRRGRWLLRTWPAWLLGTLGLLVVAGSRSWAGVASLAAGLLLVAWLSASPGNARKAWEAAFAAFVVAWIALLVVLRCRGAEGVASPSEANPVTLKGIWDLLDTKVHGRAGLSGVAVDMARQSPWLGVGLGAFVDAYPRFGHSNATLAFAHNDYVQLVAEAGVAGALLAVVAAGIVLVRVGRRWQHALPDHKGLAIGAAGALVAILAHSLFDWNLHVPANAWIFAVLCGLLLATTADQAAHQSLARSGSASKAWRWAVTAGVVVALGLCVDGAVRDVLADRAVMPLRRALAMQRKPRSGLTDAEKRFALQAAIPKALRGAELRPSSALDAETIAAAYLHLSGGRASPELAMAEEWFRRARQLCPVRDCVKTTLIEIAVVRSRDKS